jgi:hypothetical protein
MFDEFIHFSFKMSDRRPLAFNNYVYVFNHFSLKQSERPLAFYKYYSESNCAAECRANFTISHCGCLPHFMPGNRKIETGNRKNDSGNNTVPLCGPTARSCINEALLDHYEQV